MSARENGKCEFTCHKVSEFTVLTISSTGIGRMVERRHSWESPFHVGLNDIPLVGVVESIRRSIRDLECVGWIDLILVLLLDVVVLLVASNSLLLCRFFVQGRWEVFLAWNDG